MCCCTSRSIQSLHRPVGCGGHRRARGWPVCPGEEERSSSFCVLSLRTCMICPSGGTPCYSALIHTRRKKNGAYLGSKRQNACTVVLWYHWMLSILIPFCINKALLSKPVHAPCILPSSMPRELASTLHPPPQQLLCLSHPGTSLGVICHLVRHLCSIRSAVLYHLRHRLTTESCHEQPFPSRLLCSPSSTHPPVLQDLKSWSQCFPSLVSAMSPVCLHLLPWL